MSEKNEIFTQRIVKIFQEQKIELKDEFRREILYNNLIAFGFKCYREGREKKYE